MLPRNDLRGVNRMFCSVYKYGCASVAFSFGEVVTAVLVLTCRFSCLQKKGGEKERKKKKKKKKASSHISSTRALAAKLAAMRIQLIWLRNLIVYLW